MKSTWIGSWAAAAIIAAGAIGSASSVQAGETSIYFKSGWYTWDEKVNGGYFVKEKGYLHGIGVTRKDPVSVVQIAERLEVWGGNLDYDGHDITGAIPIKSDTSYLGTREEVAVSVKIPAVKRVEFEPFLGLGHKFWIRTRSSEDWNTFYAKGGAAVQWTSGKATVFLKGGAIVPIYTRTHVSLSDIGLDDVVTEPSSKVSPYAEGGIRFGAFTVSVEYEGMEFGASSKVAIRNSAGAAKGAVVVQGEAYQPASSSNYVSLKLAYTF